MDARFALDKKLIHLVSLKQEAGKCKDRGIFFVEISNLQINKKRIGKTRDLTTIDF
jgi:hypothetical protein